MILRRLKSNFASMCLGVIDYRSRSLMILTYAMNTDIFSHNCFHRMSSGSEEHIFLLITLLLLSAKTLSQPWLHPIISSSAESFNAHKHTSPCWTELTKKEQTYENDLYSRQLSTCVRYHNVSHTNNNNNSNGSNWMFVQYY